MKKIHHRILGFILSVVMLLSVGSVAAFAEDYSFTYFFANEAMTEIYITGFKGLVPDNGVVIIPDAINNYEVIGIAEYAFKNLEELEGVVIPDDLAYVDENAFYGCGPVEVVYKSDYDEDGFDSSDTFEDHEMDFIISGTTLVGYKGEDTIVAIPYNCTAIADGAFKSTNIRAVSIPSSITRISDSAFRYCSILRYVVLPDTLTEIGSYAFYDTSIASINIPASVKKIDDYAFYECTNLKTVVIPWTVKEMGIGIFNLCWNIEKAIFRNSPEVIPEDTFSGCRKLVSVSIPASVKTIADSAFAGCDVLKDINFAGTEAQWNEMVIEKYNDPLYTADVHYDAKIKTEASFTETNDVKLNGKVITAKIGLTLFNFVDQATMGTTFKDAKGNILAPGATLTTGVKVILADKTEYTLSLNGDVDCDGTLAAADARIALRAAVGLETLSAAQKLAADKEADGTITAADARILLRVSVGLPEKEPEKPVEPEKPALTISAEQYKYLAGTDFRSVRRDYPSAVANGAYVVAYVNANGEQCILTYVSYKIQTNWSKTTLHNITTGKTIKDPEAYYDSLASGAWGANRIKYMNLKTEVMTKELVCMREYSNILKTGTHSGAGVYVDARTLNL